MRWSISNQVIEAGRNLLEQHRILEVVPKWNEKQWHGVVMTDRIYHVILDGTEKEEDACDCLEFAKKGYCAHSVACELYLRAHHCQRLMTTHDDNTAMIDNNDTDQRFTFIKEALVTQEVTPLKLHPYLYIDDHECRISFKLSQRHEKRNYIVKECSVFINAYTRGQIMTLGQHQVFVHRTSFDDNDQAILSLLEPFFELYPKMMTGTEGRYLSLPPKIWIELAQKLSSFQACIINQTPCSFDALSGKYPLTLNISKQDDLITVQLKKHSDFWMKGALQYFITEQGYYTLSLEDKQCFDILTLLFTEQDTITLPQQQTMFFFSVLLPILDRHLHITMNEALENHLKYYPLEVMLNATMQHHKIMITPYFLYGPYRFELEANRHPFVIRHIREEKHVVEQLQQLGYHRKQHQMMKSVNTKEALYHFFKKDVPRLKQLALLNLDQTLKMQQIQPEDVHITANEEHQFLEIHFDISSIKQEDIQPLIQHIQEKDHFYETSEGTWIDLTDQALQPIHQTLSKIRQTIAHSGTVRVPNYQALDFEHDRISGKTLETLIHYLKKDQSYPIELPKTLNATLRPYQKEGVAWLAMLSHYGLSGILADDMGLGKTIQTIAYLLLEKEKHPEMNALIIAPASVIYNWQKEIEKFAPTLSSQVIYGKKKDRHDALLGGQDITITSYASFRQDVEWYQQRDTHILILDEAQMVKNPNSQTFKAIQSLNRIRTFALSGTPIENKREEIWAIFQLLMPGFLSQRRQFIKMSPEAIAKKIQPFVLRRTKQEVLKELPERSDHYFYSAMTLEQKKLYLAYLKQMRDHIDEMDDATLKKNRIPILAGLTRLRQICCSPEIVDKTYDYPSGKVEQLKELVTQAVKQGHRILLFSQFTSMLHVLETVMKECHCSYFMLTGKTKTEERQKMCDAFNNGERDVFLISLKAGGAGLNLTGADIVILFDSWWNPAVEEQAAGRAHRMGQTQNVEVWHFIAEGTIEEKIDELQHRKRALFDAVMTAQPQDQLQNLSDDDIRYLLAYNDEEREE